MTQTVGATLEFLNHIVSGSSEARLLELNYGVLASDLIDLIEKADERNTTTVQILNGLIRANRVRGLAQEQLVCKFSGNLQDLKNDYLPLAICCGRALAHSNFISAEDYSELVANGIDVAIYPGASPTHLIKPNTGNIVSSWSLVEGGDLRLSSFMPNSFKDAAEVRIYDPYFNIQCALIVRELMDFTRNLTGRDFSCKFEIGIGNSSVDVTAVRALLEPFFSDPLFLDVFRTQRFSTTTKYIHDRYIQINQSSTYCFTAGIGSLTAGDGGRNRASLITLSDLFVGYTEMKMRKANGDPWTVKA